MTTYSLPLFPLNVVVCPGGVLHLKIFEARYLDMVRDCLRNKSYFVVATESPKGEADLDADFPFADIGTVVKIIDMDVTTVGLMLICCVGEKRVKINSFEQQTDGLVMGKVTDIPNEPNLPIPENLWDTSRWLKKLLESLPEQQVSPEQMPVIKPYQLEDASWVSNRWVELLDLPLLQKQRLMQLESPILRLKLIHDILDVDVLKTA